MSQPLGKPRRATGSLLSKPANGTPVGSTATRTSSIISNPYRQSLLHASFEHASPSSSQQHQPSQQSQQSLAKRRSTLLSTPASTNKRRQSGGWLSSQHVQSAQRHVAASQPTPGSSQLLHQTTSSQQSTPHYALPTSQQQLLQQAQKSSADPRPLRDKKYQELILKEIIRYLVDSKFELKTNIALTENILKLPTQKNFNAIFQFMYNQIDPSYVFIKPVEQEITGLLKILNYPYMSTITRSHFSAVGGSNWPTFLGILYWLVELSLSFALLPEKDFLADDDFDRLFIGYLWQAYPSFLNADDAEYFNQYSEELKLKYVDVHEKWNEEFKSVQEQQEELKGKYEEVNAQLKVRDDADRKTVALEDDYIKLKAYNDDVQKRIPDWNQKLEQLLNEVISMEQQVHELQDQKRTIEKDLEDRGISIDHVNEMHIERDRISKSIDSNALKVEEAKDKLLDRAFELERNYESIESVTKQYNDFARRINNYVSQITDESLHATLGGFKFLLVLREEIKNPNQQYTREEIFLNTNLKDERQNLLKFRNETDSQILKIRGQAVKISEQCDVEQDKIRDQQALIEELQIQDSITKRKSDDVKQQMFQTQSEYSNEIEELEQQTRDTKAAIQSDILQLERKLRDVNLEKARIVDDLTAKRQKMDEDVTRITATILNFKTNIQERMIRIADLVQDQLRAEHDEETQGL
ncbi:putative kinetochore protein NDC80 [Candida viswanathii]|uniref:Kinetochore protein NDC80 n=1 Tax=Candida viswanathii TaxID=5486 RepID=A0A367Y9G9_9ASCO|nr:putative kinetochore protein NDC80 [Candida viswanathii]